MQLITHMEINGESSVAPAGVIGSGRGFGEVRVKSPWVETQRQRLGNAVRSHDVLFLCRRLKCQGDLCKSCSLQVASFLL